MTEQSQAVIDYWDRADLVATVLGSLREAGKDLDNLTVDDLALTDQFHSGGFLYTFQLAELAGLDRSVDPPRRVLDVGGGLGGPARLLASKFGCHVTSVDITPSYVEVARKLTELVGLADQVVHRVGDALNLPFEDDTFDVVWTQNSGMAIADKSTMYTGFHRVLKPGGMLVTQEPVAGKNTPPYYPLMWANDPTTDLVVDPATLRSMIRAAGLVETEWRLIVPPPAAPTPTPTLPPAHHVFMIIMGAERLRAIIDAAGRNQEEERTALVHAVCHKPV